MAVDNPTRPLSGAAFRWKTLSVYLILAVAAFHQFQFLSMHWFPHDDGSLALAAWRMNEGDVLYRDILPVYNGGMDYFHALLFKIGGTDFMTLRIGLWATSILAVLFLTRTYLRELSWPESILLTVACMFWGPGNYPAPMPSWYNLFLAMLAYAVITTGAKPYSRSRWFVCGVLTGLSLLVKLTGLYLLAVFALLAIYRNQQRCLSEKGPHSHAARASIVAGLALFVMAVAVMIYRSHPKYLAELVFYFVFPVAACGGYLMRREFMRKSSALVPRWMDLMKDALPYALGFAVPCLLFLAVLQINGTLPMFIQHQFVDTLGRIASIFRPPLDNIPYELLGYLAVAVVLVLALLSSYARVPAAVNLAVGGVLVLFLAYILIQAPENDNFYSTAWAVCRATLPLGVLAALAFLLTKHSSLDEKKKERLFVLMAFTSCVSLIQFPFSHGIYVLYAAPFGFLLVAELGARSHLHGRILCGLLLLYLCLMPPLLMHGRNPARFDVQVMKLDLMILGLPRAEQILAAPGEARVYTDLVTLILAITREGDGIFVLKDAPEISFMVNRRPVVPYSWGIPFEPGESRAWFENIIELLNQEGIPLVVLKVNTQFMPQLPEELIEYFRDHFPYEYLTMGGQFLVLWRDRPTGGDFD